MKVERNLILKRCRDEWRAMSEDAKAKYMGDVEAYRQAYDRYGLLYGSYANYNPASLYRKYLVSTKLKNV
jgi:hypothetical protein